MKMSFNQAQQILDAAGVVNDFVEPGPDIPDSVAVAMFERRVEYMKHLNTVIMSVLREMVIDEAKEVCSAHERR